MGQDIYGNESDIERFHRELAKGAKNLLAKVRENECLRTAIKEALDG